MPLSRRQLLAGTAAFAAFASPLRAAGPLAVVATTGMIADTARRLGGDALEVRALMGPGVDPHSYRQTRSDIVAMTRAGLVLASGLYLEAQMEEFLEDLSRRVPVAQVAEVLPREVLMPYGDHADRFDPHVWMDPGLWAGVAEGMAATLSAARPEAAETVAGNSEALTADLDRLSAYAGQVLGSVPDESRVLVTAHDAFGYLGRAFGMEVVGIQGISTESEAGLNRISELVDLLVERRIRAVFVESSVSDRNMRALIEGAAAKGHEVAVGGELFSDAMGVPGTYEGTYPGMIDHNVTVIARALGGTAPERGMDGRLGGAS
ncbi:metal ABC transporter solute-binding protein, Zn/Mn family [Mangrovicoccus sp. HB161399]|uniref:metal ABC transporter solute-binding protein, Zn/Mn family n=1 Tax=Mangrovicoccus sp. HB161399 TaxID=2720392 RepID=UPI001552F3A3|nr:zinc ABC transporter substrate-binding protein [Mangrovicoccus sp. HB161399]